ncbi:cobalt-precorrin-7 (C(5))-methyltransferase [Cellulosilyticum ruminicola]|uniref:cobalt-precorrin-7 (C(5))-methyltransferase n=1 Tax=Cellulosilyticum ruminicola TaxID=425254 RepID=UPI0006D0A49D|nr:cobalt-precorrin-7 (C(5))-methyltransferase [Cellulosilyticum ruminicola]
MINIVGLGPGNIKLITDKGKAAIAQSDVLIGGKRNLQSLEEMFTGETLEIGNNLKEILQFIKVNYLNKEITVVASGDPMLYGIGKYLSEQLEEGSFEIISGISATTYMFSQIPMNMNDVYITSSHGKIPNFPFILAHEKVAMVTDDKIGPYEIAKEIIKSGLNKMMWIGENLSYDNERITKLRPEEVLETENYEMNVVVIVDEK